MLRIDIKGLKFKPQIVANQSLKGSLKSKDSLVFFLNQLRNNVHSDGSSLLKPRKLKRRSECGAFRQRRSWKKGINREKAKRKVGQIAALPQGRAGGGRVRAPSAASLRQYVDRM